MLHDFADFVVCTFSNDAATVNIERMCPDEDFLVESIVQAGQFYTVAFFLNYWENGTPEVT